MDDINYGELVEEIFESNDWNFTAKRKDDDTFFAIPWSAKNLPGLDVKLIVSDDGDCKIRCYLAREVPDSKRPAMLAVLNALNNQYRYITLSIDSDGDILAAYDFRLFSDAETTNKQVGMMIFFTTKIMDKCVPKIMKVLWQDDDEDDED